MSAFPANTDASLLWPHGRPPTHAAQTAAWHDRSAADLGIEELARLLSIDRRFIADMQSILMQLCADPDVINYRQRVLEDLAQAPEFAQDMEALMPVLVEVSYYADSRAAYPSALHQALRRLSELEMYVECVKQLNEVLQRHGGALKAEAWQRLRDQVAQVETSDTFRSLAAELPTLAEEVRGISSVTIGVNLDPQLLPVEATLLSVNSRRYRGASGSLIGKLLGRKSVAEEYQGIARLHAVPPKQGGPPGMGTITRENPLLVPLFRDLNDILQTAAKELATALSRYVQVSGQFLVALLPELAFFLGGLHLVHKLRAAGLPMCRPDIRPADERSGQIHSCYNVILAHRLHSKQPDAKLSEQVVCNDVDFGEAGRIFILTGPNQGGKTTYAQAVGLAHVLAQAGLYVPGADARISPVDAIHTHFQGEEKPNLDTGRLGEEALRLSAIFDRATRHSLILLNESLSSTSFGEGVLLAEDVVRGFRLLGARVIFCTHLHELAAAAEAINADTPGDSRVASLVAMVVVDGADGAARRTYKIVPCPPTGSSYARDIARRYGISFEQIRDKLDQRG